MKITEKKGALKMSKINSLTLEALEPRIAPAPMFGGAHFGGNSDHTPPEEATDALTLARYNLYQNAESRAGGELTATSPSGDELLVSSK